MNLFILDEDVKKNAEYHCDKHVVKMIIEATQMIFVAVYFSLGITHKDELTEKVKRKLLKNEFKEIPLFDTEGNKKLYGMTHVNHPCSVWIRNCRENFEYACDLGIALCEEYTRRYGKEHSNLKLLKFLKKFSKRFRKNGGREEFKICIAYPECIYEGEAVKSYRTYYVHIKNYMAKWNKIGNKPDWYKKKNYPLNKLKKGVKE